MANTLLSCCHLRAVKVSYLSYSTHRANKLEYRLLERPRSDTMGISTNPEWLASLGLPVPRRPPKIGRSIFLDIPIDVLMRLQPIVGQPYHHSFFLFFNIVDKRISRSTTVAIRASSSRPWALPWAAPLPQERGRAMMPSFSPSLPPTAIQIYSHR